MESLPTGPSSSAGSQWVFYYDGGCGLCRRLVAVLARADLTNAILWVPFQSLQRPPGDLTWDDLDRAAYLDAGQGPPRAGFLAIRELTWKLPLLWPLAPVFWFPGIHRPGGWAYRWVAAHRHRFFSCNPQGQSPPGASAAPPFPNDLQP